MDDHGDAVGGKVHVEFDAIGALLERQFEGGEGILGRLARGPAMAEKQPRPPRPARRGAWLWTRSAKEEWHITPRVQEADEKLLPDVILRIPDSFQLDDKESLALVNRWQRRLFAEFTLSAQ